MPSDPLDNIISSTPDWRGKALAKLRRAIHAADPEIGEAVRWRRPSSPMGAPVWEHNGITCVGNILKRSVRLTFPTGATLPDPRKLFNARLDSSSARAVDFFEGEKLNEPAPRALVRSAVKQNLARSKSAKARKR